jgi:hypothetical protein
MLVSLKPIERAMPSVKAAALSWFESRSLYMSGASVYTTTMAVND